ncbi:P-loop containing nucleoside triphosphate hydrolase protein [Exidia glandulosa HHB12029]|uniref:p-loop containing nucleoside triphosphate hydrolase protein n=1 Tax=Exidia glandulosa HHB12029 TaxID=1314781 RepID=A0A165E7T4_EXIGL|nr:P-loop containing nucleoside triphosphate hydrolase protein [Exidia glandulosa HHB12029]
MPSARRRAGRSAQALTTRTSYVKREVYNVFFDTERSRAQRDRLAMDLYAILFAFVTELANHKTEPAAEQRSVTLVQQHGQNGLDEFAIHFCDELVQAHVFTRVFDEQAPEAAQMAHDGISVPSVVTVDNAACVELLRGVRERGLVKHKGVVGAISRSSTAFRQGKSSSSSVGGGDELTLRFGIKHYAGSCAYDARNFVERDADVLDPALVSLLRASGEPFKGADGDENGYAELDPSKVYSVGTQLNTAVSELLRTLDATRM